MSNHAADAPPVTLPGGDSEMPTGHPVSGVAALNAAAIVIAALYLGRDLLQPIVLAVLLAFVLAPLVVWLQRARLPRAPSVLIAVALAFALIIGIGFVVVHQATLLIAQLPSYEPIVQDKLRSLAVGGDLMDRLNHGLHDVMSRLGGPGETPTFATAPASPAPASPAPASPAPASPAPAPPAPAAAATNLDASSAFMLLRTVIAPVLSPLATAGVVSVFAIFVLLAREDLRDRLVRLLGRRDLHRTILAMTDAGSRLSRYFLFQLMLNAAFGLFVGVGLWAVGLPGAPLWGILTGIMRFVPFIGTAIAVLPPAVLAAAVAPGWSLALIVLALFIVSDLVISQVIEPLLYGHSTGLSPIAVIVAAAFWAFMWGPVGLLLATPLTVCLVVLGRYVEPLNFLDVMLSDRAPLEPAETFYQRALEGNHRELADQARRTIAEAGLAEYYDRVAIPGLALAQGDLERDALAFERLEAIHAEIDTLLATIGQMSPDPDAAATLPPAWRRPGAITCIPGRGQLDGLVAVMAAQTLGGAGFGVVQTSNAAVSTRNPSDAGSFGEVSMACLSVLDKGSTASGIRFLLRRIRRQMPGAVLVVCLWHAETVSPLLQALRAEGEDETIVLSLGELVALARALSARTDQTRAEIPA